MSYKKANRLLPLELLQQIQEYVDGEYIYIPRINNQKKKWGENTNIRTELNKRNRSIYQDYERGISSIELAKTYFLSIKSIQRIIYQNKQNENEQ